MRKLTKNHFLFIYRSNIVEFYVAIANCFGMFLVTVLLGHGLIAIPKKFKRINDYEI